MALRKPTPAAVLLLFGSAIAPAPAAAQGQWMDIGSGASYTIVAEHDPRSFERFPPFAFGNWDPGVYSVYAELIPRPCSSLPSTAICEGGRVVAAFDGYLYVPDNCPCSGLLFEPVELELHYDPARLAALGGREEDLRLLLYDNLRAEWVPVDDQRVVPERDVVTGSRLGYGGGTYVLLHAPATGGPSSWGRIKAQWTNR